MLSTSFIQFNKIDETVPQLQDENGNDIQPEDASVSDLQQELEKLHSDFIAAGKIVKEAVDQRTELYMELDSSKQMLALVEVANAEVGIDDIDLNDPLYFIESDFPFFRDAEKCGLEDIGNIEVPKKCMAAMDAFVLVLRENLHRFKHLPKGPLYQNITVKERKWAPLAEYVLRPYLFSFLVDNIVDGLVMEELLAQHFPSSEPGSINKHGVVCPRYHLFAFKSQNLGETRITAISGLELENMLESLHFDDEDWGNFLSDVINVEKIVFMDNENAAFLVMSHIRSTPWHCKMAYTLDGFIVHPFPNFRTKKIRFHPRPVYLSCIPSFEYITLNIRIKRIHEKITSSNKDIETKREEQLKLALQLDAVGHLYSKAKAKEKENRPKNKKRAKKTKRY